MHYMFIVTYFQKNNIQKNSMFVPTSFLSQYKIPDVKGT